MKLRITCSRPRHTTIGRPVWSRLVWSGLLVGVVVVVVVVVSSLELVYMPLGANHLTSKIHFTFD